MPLLYVTDLAYPARGRRYCDEDILLTSRLREHFPLALCHPLDAAAMMADFDAVIVRNSGPVLHYQEAYDAFRAAALAAGTRVYNPLTGRGDMAGKQYLLDLTAAGHPVIPTIDDPADLAKLPPAPSYAVKPKQGADSIGLTFTPHPAGPAGRTSSSRASTSRTRCPSTSSTTPSSTPSTPRTRPAAGSWCRTGPPRRTSTSPAASSSGTPCRTASSGWTPAAPPPANSSWSSLRT